MGVDERVANDWSKSHGPTSNSHKLAHCFFKDPVAHELRFTLLKLIGAKDAVSITQIGKFEVKFERSKSHTFQRGGERTDASDQGVRFPRDDS
jgi:hypothetical protein